jgi:transposase IS116/IS110/IS902 family protein
MVTSNTDATTGQEAAFGFRFEVYYDAEVLAAANWLLVTDQIPLMLPPAPMNKAAEASATNAMSNVYSIKSCPLSSFQSATRSGFTKLLPPRPNLNGFDSPRQDFKRSSTQIRIPKGERRAVNARQHNRAVGRRNRRRSTLRVRGTRARCALPPDRASIARTRSSRFRTSGTAMTYFLTIEDTRRFRKSRDVGSFLGMCPRRSQSGQRDPQVIV